MKLKELLEEPIDSFWNENLSHIDIKNTSLEEFDEICKSVLISPFNEIEFRSKNSKEYLEFKKSINITNEESYNNLLKFMDSIDNFNEEIVVNLSQFLYYEFHFIPNHFYQGRFPSFRKLSNDDIRKLILLNDSLIKGFELKDEDKLSIFRVLSCGYSLGEWGKIDAAESVFNLINKTLNINKPLILDNSVDNSKICTPIKDAIDYPRFSISLVHPMGKIYQLKGQYQKSIDVYVNGVNTDAWNDWTNFSAHTRHIEDLVEAYKSSELMGDAEQCVKLYELIKKNFTDSFSIRFDVGGEKNHEIAREPSMVAMMIRDKIYKNLK